MQLTNKLSITEAIQIVLEARRQVKKTPTYRLGQAIYNLLPKHISSEEVVNLDNHYRWYNSLDEVYCIEYFYTNMVEELPKITCV